MIEVPLAAVPAQTLNVTLDGQNVALSVYTLGNSAVQNLFVDVLNSGVVVKTCILALNLMRLLTVCQYSGFVGDFVFVDTQGNSDPNYAGLGSRFLLVYLEASDLG